MTNKVVRGKISAGKDLEEIAREWRRGIEGIADNHPMGGGEG